MAARAIWKGVVRIGSAKLPVKLYSAVQDQTIHFRLLHASDHQPVQQKMIDAENGEPVESKEVRKAFPLGRGRLLMLGDEDLEKLEPKESRDIEVTRFVDPAQIDHRWYERAYYLGPDGDSKDYFAAADALEKKKKEGVARWVMRNRQYVGALRSDGGYLMLIVLRYADEVIDVDSLPKPSGRPLQKKEVAMAEQLVSALSGRFDPSEYRDEYRARVMDLIKTKERGGKPKVTAFRPKKQKEDQLDDVLAASLAELRGKKAS